MGINNSKREEKPQFELVENLVMNKNNLLLQLFKDKSNQLFLHRPDYYFEEVIFIEQISDKELIIGVYWKHFRKYTEHKFIKRSKDDSYIWIYPYQDEDSYVQGITMINHDVVFLGKDSIINTSKYDDEMFNFCNFFSK